MKYSITFNEKDYAALVENLLGRETERAAYVLCRPSITEDEIRLIAKDIIFLQEDEIEESSATHMKIPSRSFTKAMKAANDKKECFVFVHSHPTSVPNHSTQDDEQEKGLFRTAYNRIRTAGVHASMVMSTRDNPRARIWLEDNTFVAVSTIRVIGNRFRFYSAKDADNANPIFFDRQIRAFGSAIQNLLGRLTVGVIGVGGTGSAVTEEIVRLGVGNLLLIDGGSFEGSNINRVYGSRLVDDGIPKVKIAERLAADIGLGTDIKMIYGSITTQEIAKKLRSCDIIFGCTDDESGRAILSQLAVYYSIPVFDMGVKIDSDDEMIKSVEGRVTTLLPGAACLFCRGRISSNNIRAESLERNNPNEAAAQRREGYVPELNERAPSVIPFTTAVAAVAVSEFLHRLTGYLGDERISTEVIYQFHETKLRTNSNPPKEDCWCSDSVRINRADVTPFLDTTW